MKILAFSDLHLARARAADLVAASEAADLVIGAGDFCNMRNGLDDAMDLLAGISVPMIVVPGNAESADELSAAKLANMTVLHGAAHQVAGLRFFGLGGAVPQTPFGDWSFDLSETTAAALLARCTATDVLVVHSPPKGVVDVAANGMSLGSQAIHDVITRVQPWLALCGHIHDSWGKSAMIGATRVCNLGPTVNWFEVTA